VALVQVTEGMLHLVKGRMGERIAAVGLLVGGHVDEHIGGGQRARGKQADEMGRPGVHREGQDV